jgi:hypothetical protein
LAFVFAVGGSAPACRQSDRGLLSLHLLGLEIDAGPTLPLQEGVFVAPLINTARFWVHALSAHILTGVAAGPDEIFAIFAGLFHPLRNASDLLQYPIEKCPLV